MQEVSGSIPLTSTTDLTADARFVIAAPRRGARQVPIV
jgi:hypothetical protein